MTTNLHTKRPRIIALDLIRGLFLLIILADHLAWTPSLFLQSITAYTGMIASAAEGFFVISGILVGYIYGPKILAYPKKTTVKLLRRGLVLYTLAVVFTLFYTTWAYFLPDGYPRSSVVIAETINNALTGALTLTYTFGWADFLGRYAIFMTLAPLALWLIATRKSYIVLIISGLVWLLLREAPPFATFTAWQIIFFSGIIIGYYLPKIENFAIATEYRKQILLSLTMLSLVSFVLAIIFVAAPPLLLLSFDTVINTNVTDTLIRINGLRESILLYFDKSTMSILRLIIGALWFSGLYYIFRRYEATINKYSCGILLTLGQYSLFVYSIQALLIFTIDTIFTPPSYPNPSLILLNTFIGILCATITYLATLLYAKRITIYTKIKHLRAIK